MAEVARPLAAVLSSLRLGPVLEVGCGDGEFTELLVENLGGWDYIEAVDMAEETVAEARDYFEKAHPGATVSFRVADAGSLPFEAGSFDAAAVSNTIHHMKEPEQSLREVLRVVRPGGRIIINEMFSDVEDPREEVGRDLHHLKAWVDRTHGVSHNPTWSRAALFDLFRRLGLFDCDHLEYPRSEITDADVDIEDRISHIDEYADHAAGSPDYPGIRREVSRLKQRLRAVGFAAAPQLLVLCTTPTQSGRHV
jgi:SAM-dependent methyltransferase